MVQSIIIFGLILIGLIVIHELGHFITAKLTGVKVLEFGLGYPPKLFGIKRGETEYTVNLLPLGGFVRLLGEEDPTDPRSLAAQPHWVRLLVLAAGSVMNLILPIVLFAVAFMIPRDVPVGLVQIAAVEPGGPAEEAGLRPGDVILGINGDEVRNVAELGREIRLNMGDTVDFRIRRTTQEFGTSGSNEILNIPVEARYRSQGPTGIEIQSQVSFYESESYPPWEAVGLGWDATIDSLRLARNEVISWFQGSSGPEVAGPVGLAQATDEVVEEAGYRPLLDFAALLSINLGILNLLPLPMLDGGRIAFVLLEIVRRGKRIAPEKEGLVHLVGFALIITLAVVVTYVEIMRIIDGDSLFR
jgi:regulator of sigma E protease